MDPQVCEILLKKNLPHVITVFDKDGNTEELSSSDDDGKINIRHVILGMAELNKNGISLLEISVGTSKEGITKIKSIESARVSADFKADSWALGEFIVKYQTDGKTIPKKFMKSQNLMNTFIESLNDDHHQDILKKVLVIDPQKREYTWNLIREDEGCTIH